MRANEIFHIKLDINGEQGIFNGRVLYWWEEQNIKIDNLYEDPNTKKLMIEHSKIFIDTINKFLISVESDGKTTNKDNLHQISMEKNKNIQWSDILHHSVVSPLYSAYISVSGSSIEQIKDFRKKVMASYDKGLRMESFDDFPPPPEVIEFDLISTNGILTRNDILNMSYSEILKFQVVRDVNNRYKSKPTNYPHQNIQASQFFNSNLNQDGFNPDNVNEIAKQFFPNVTV